MKYDNDRMITHKLRLILNSITAFLIVMLVVSCFFDFVVISSKLLGFTTYNYYSFFDLFKKEDIFAQLSVIFVVVEFVLGLGIVICTILEVLGIVKRPMVKDILAISLMIVTILSIVCLLIFCISNTPYDTNTDTVKLKFYPGIGMYFSMICGFGAGLASAFDSPLILPESIKHTKTIKRKKKKSTTKKK